MRAFPFPDLPFLLANSVYVVWTVTQVLPPFLHFTRGNLRVSLVWSLLRAKNLNPCGKSLRTSGLYACVRSHCYSNKYTFIVWPDEHSSVRPCAVYIFRCTFVCRAPCIRTLSRPRLVRTQQCCQKTASLTAGHHSFPESSIATGCTLRLHLFAAVCWKLLLLRSMSPFRYNERYLSF